MPRSRDNAHLKPFNRAGADKFAQDGRGDQNANETSKLVSSLLGPTAPNALSIGRLRVAEPLERTRLLLSVCVCGQTLLTL
jgi:hypothetical protein